MDTYIFHSFIFVIKYILSLTEGSVNIDQLMAKPDISVLQDNLVNIAFCNIHKEFVRSLKLYKHALTKINFATFCRTYMTLIQTS